MPGPPGATKRVHRGKSGEAAVAARTVGRWETGGKAPEAAGAAGPSVLNRLGRREDGAGVAVGLDAAEGDGDSSPRGQGGGAGAHVSGGGAKEWPRARGRKSARNRRMTDRADPTVWTRGSCGSAAAVD